MIDPWLQSVLVKQDQTQTTKDESGRESALCPNCSGDEAAGQTDQKNWKQAAVNPGGTTDKRFEKWNLWERRLPNPQPPGEPK